MTHFHRLFLHYYSVPARKYSLLFFVLLLALGSCKLTKQSTYFSTITKDTTITGFIPNDFESTIRKGDQLSITVTSLSAVEDEQFNKAAAVSASPAMSGFTVYPDGAVLLHRLGRVKVEGLTRRELAAKLEKDLQSAQPSGHSVFSEKTDHQGHKQCPGVAEGVAPRGL